MPSLVKPSRIKKLMDLDEQIRVTMLGNSLDENRELEGLKIAVQEEIRKEVAANGGSVYTIGS